MGGARNYTWALITIAHIAVILIFISLIKDVSQYISSVAARQAQAYNGIEDI